MYKYDNSNYRNTIDLLLLNHTIDIADLPFEVRTIEPTFYTTALRYSRGISSKKIIEVLSLLCSDIERLYHNHYKEKERLCFLRILYSYVMDIKIISNVEVTSELMQFLQDAKERFGLGEHLYFTQTDCSEPIKQ